MTDEMNNSLDTQTGDAPPNDTTPLWWIDDNLPGSGDRPDWLPEKFKTAKDVANSYKELESRLGSAPKEYDFSKGESWLDPEFESIKQMADYAKSKNVPQDVMDKVLESVGSYIEDFKVDFAKEKEKLGPDADDRLQVLDNWAKANFSEETFDALTSTMNNADAIKAIEEIRTKMIENNNNIPSGNESSDNGAASIEDLQAELTENLDKYKNDPKWRREYQRRLEQASKDGPYSDKEY